MISTTFLKTLCAYFVRCFIQVEPEDLPDTNSVDKQYVYLVAKSDDGHFQFHKEAKILLSYNDGMVFIQTDKPIYTPRQSGRYCRITFKLGFLFVGGEPSPSTS